MFGVAHSILAPVVINGTEEMGGVQKGARTSGPKQRSLLRTPDPDRESPLREKSPRVRVAPGTLIQTGAELFK